jgi:hypothetical protein
MARIRRQHPGYVTCRHCAKDFRAITVLHLRNIHGYDGDHPIREYKRKFQLPSATCLDVRRRISEALAACWAKRGRHWSRAGLLAEIRRRHRSGRSLRPRRVPVRVYQAGRRFFGTWQAAVERTGLRYEEVTGVRHWSPEKVLDAIRGLADPGVPLSASYAKAHHPGVYKAAVVQFPSSWSKALSAAGFDPAQHKTRRGRWDREKAADWVRKRVAKGRSILTGGVPRDLLGFIYGRLGMTWPEFVESLGIAYPGVKRRREWTKQKLLEVIRRWHAEGHRLNYKAVQSEYPALIHQARRFFGSWDRARAAAGC